MQNVQYGNTGDKPITYKTQRVRVIVDGWYALNHPVRVDQLLELPVPDAASMRSLGRVEYVA